ncbi:hypothetical protein GALL_71430 [mine drainage metagenome]|uniref:DUF2460 domain-containing protein n=1 Tax=mine drainage metagenome TaxID=410659 RepID=A0A1J5TB13_9ZZZZ
MSNNVFPILPGLAWNIHKRPTWKTRIQRSVGGWETRVAQQLYPIWEFELPYEFLRSAGGYSELQTLMGFYLARQGSFDNFLYTDSSDSSVTAQQFGTGDGATVAFQLSRPYGGFAEPVQNINGTPAIYVNGTLKTAGTDYNINSTGLVTFTAAPANGAVLTWTGNYYYRVRFAEDNADFTNVMNNLWELKKLNFLGSVMNKV